MNEHLEIIKENSILNESIGVSDTDEIVSRIIDQKYKDSLAYQVCDVQPIHGPTGGVFAVKWNGTKTYVQRNNVTLKNDPIIDTGFSLEAIQDLQTQFGKNAMDFISKVFAGISNSEENTYLISQMDAFAVDKGSATLTDSGNAESIFFEVAQKVSESIIEINTKENYRSMDAFVILPIKAAAALMGLGVYFNDNIDNEAGLFLGKIRKTKYYINPDINSTTAFVGINPEVPGGSSMIFSPYQHTMMSATNPDTGDTNVFIVNRYAVTQSAGSTTDNEMLHKFTIN